MLFKKVRGASSHSGNGKSLDGRVSILGAGMISAGEIVSDGDVRILGTHSGNLVVHSLTLGRGGSIIGTVKAQSAVIDGDLSGQLTAASIVLGPNASVTADIFYVSIRIEPGAVHEGYNHHVDSLEKLPANNIVKLSLPQRRRPQRTGGGQSGAASAAGEAIE